MWIAVLIALAAGFLLGKLDAVRRFNRFVALNPPMCASCQQEMSDRWKENSSFDLAMNNR